jgi:hypothetical protein
VGWVPLFGRVLLPQNLQVEPLQKHPSVSQVGAVLNWVLVQFLGVHVDVPLAVVLAFHWQIELKQQC